MAAHRHILLMPSPSDESQKAPCNQPINSSPLRPALVSVVDNQMPWLVNAVMKRPEIWVVS